MTDNMDLMSFDDVATSRPVIADGDYTLKIVEPKLNDSRDKTSKYITYSAIVQTGPNAGYRVFNGLYSLKPEQTWQFKRDMKAASFAIPSGLTIIEAAQHFVDSATGFEFVGRVGSRIQQVKDDAGNYIPDPDGNRENVIKRWLGPAQ